MHLYVCMYLNVGTHMPLRYTSVYVIMCSCMYVCMSVCIHAPMYVYMNMSMYVYVCVCL